MSFSQKSATGFVPTLSRVVLALVFISVGYTKIFTDKEFTADEAAVLQKHGVEVTPIPVDAPESTEASDMVQHGGRVVFASTSLQDDPPEEADAPPAIEGEPVELPDPSTDPPADTPDNQPPGDDPTAPEQGDKDPPADTPTAQAGAAKALYGITLMLDAKDLPLPKWGAWAAALTEFVGGSLLLIGFLSRVWGLGLAIAMGMAFYMTSYGVVVDQWNPITLWQDNPVAFKDAMWQLSLFVLAFGIFLTGPGPVSFDRAIFGSGQPANDPGDEPI